MTEWVIRPNQAILKNDLVAVIAGKGRGKRGKVLSVMSSKARVVVEKVNMVKRHQKPNQQNRTGGIVEKESSIHLTNVMLVCTKCDRPVRIRFGGKTAGERACVKCGQVIERKRAL